MTTIRYLFADHLSRSIASLADLDPAHDVVLLTEVAGEAEAVPHHPKKVAFLFSAMRHFAAGLAEEGIRVDYVKLDDPANTQSFTGELRRAMRRHGAERVVVAEPGEWRVLQELRAWRERHDVAVEIREDERFFCTTNDFARWWQKRRQPRMESFYRLMREQTGLLMEGEGEPAGGRWNFDKENRKPPPRDVEFTGPLRIEPDRVTSEVIALVERCYGKRFGDLEPFWFAVTAADAAQALEHFIETALPRFGDWQDAMLEGESFLCHAAISQYLNAGLLLPRDVCARAEQAWREGRVPINSAEGFIRQVLGWREYVRGIYWQEMPGYARLNGLGARRRLPDFYWTGRTEMACLREVVDQTRREALSHHIQRLMVTGNFALLAGVDPQEVCEWYLAVYADAVEWVELPNTLGMALHADGGLLGSKPYAASGAYIRRMSDFCASCRFDVRRKNGPGACPFNYLYWNFLVENRKALGGNPRLRNAYATLDRLPKERLKAIRADSRAFLEGLEPWSRP
ncbi:cryptochrome/photolyase family protein [Marinimicrococcus flavescens]|uniref:Cryptochrome/photolyase family protein n=1 Tax=Marinimicrococcus flavescens TaxID=3031815 RepID=A0AAP3V0V2_9PROT|nr:cryptochrome/photolyase family protein [Marinimicrococcus flavescens]